MMEKQLKPQPSPMPRPGQSTAKPLVAATSSLPKPGKLLADLWYDIRQSEHEKGKHANYFAEVNYAVAAMHQAAPPPSIFLGILGKCAIAGCDVHLLSDSGDIMYHLHESDPTPSGFETARRVINAMPPGGLSLLVYSDGIKILYVNGDVKPMAV
ncbi:MAG: hypothetical protein ORN98_05855 [Alphaproteobacteria bacterium]|nr:hypothetical protein [Alphaproteobacteria bacterium]